MTSSNISHTFRFGEKIFIGNVDNLSLELEPLILSVYIDRIIFDLESLCICDLYGINFFLQFQRKTEKFKKELILYRPSNIIRKILKDAGVFHIFKVTDKIKRKSFD